MNENSIALMFFAGCVLVVLGAWGWLGVQEQRRRNQYLEAEKGSDD